jgi:hypothetical protein
VRVALALQEHEQKILGAVRRDVFRQTEAHAHPELARFLHVGHQQLEMVEPLRHRPTVMLERDHEARLQVHGGAELNRCAAWIADVQSSALVRDFDPLRRQTGLFEERLGLLQILLGEDAHADALGLRLTFGALENEAVMARLGDAAQIDRVFVLITDDEADQIDVEIPADCQILNGEHGVAGARDIEGRVVDGLGNAHGALRR